MTIFGGMPLHLPNYIGHNFFFILRDLKFADIVCNVCLGPNCRPTNISDYNNIIVYYHNTSNTSKNVVFAMVVGVSQSKHDMDHSYEKNAVPMYVCE